jgi:integrase
VPRNVATLVDAPRVERAEIRPMTPEEARQFLDVMKDDRLEALYSVAIALGLRQGEALGLLWPDIDLVRGTLTVQRSLQRIEGKLKLVEPKTTRSRRTINLPQVAINSLLAHRARQQQERLIAGNAWQETGFVFTTSIGTPLDASTVTHRFQATLQTAGFPRTRFHDLRHTCATLLLVQGVHPRLVMEILGHSQISLTMNLYSHVIPAMNTEVAREMDALLKPVATSVATQPNSERVN